MLAIVVAALPFLMSALIGWTAVARHWEIYRFDDTFGPSEAYIATGFGITDPVPAYHFVSDGPNNYLVELRLSEHILGSSTICIHVCGERDGRYRIVNAPTVRTICHLDGVLTERALAEGIPAALLRVISQAHSEGNTSATATAEMWRDGMARGEDGNHEDAHLRLR